MPDSLQGLADRCLLPGFVGTAAPDWIRRRAAAGLGGVVLYGRNVESPEQVAALSEALHSERPELLVAIDEEGGDVTRLEARAGSSYPGNLALGVSRDAVLTRAVAASMGGELAAAGIDLDLAPDADVNSNPDNPVIGVRSFGSDPQLVSEHVAAFVAGLQQAGVAACAKHFPGHGDTAVDSHLALPVVNEDPHASGALEPFRAAIAAGVQAVMTAHLSVPSLDSLPATLSRRILGDLLRSELGFGGLVISDGIEMRAIADGVGIVAGTVQALAAGCDAICIGGGLKTGAVVDELRDGIVAAVRDGRLAEARLRDAAERVDRLAAWRRERPTRGTPVDRAIGLHAAVRALGPERPPRIGSGAVVVQLRERPNIAVGSVPWGVSDHLAELGAAPTSLEFDHPPVPVEQVLGNAAGKSLVIVVRDLHRHPWQREVVERLFVGRPDAILVEMGLPVLQPGGAGSWVRSRGASRASGRAVAEALLG